MERAAKLCPFEQGCMVELHQQGRSCRDIAAELGRSKTAVNNFLRCPEAYRTKKSTCRPKNLSQQAKNAVLRSARPSSGLSAWQIAAENGLDVSKDTISRCPKAEGFRRWKRLCQPRLLERHKVREQDLAPLFFTREAVPGKLQAPHLVTFKKAQALSSTEALGLKHREMVSLLTSRPFSAAICQAERPELGRADRRTAFFACWERFFGRHVDFFVL